MNTMDGADYHDKYCKNNAINAKQPTLFEYEFTIGDKCFAYGFTVNLENNFVLSEWLYELNADNEEVIFERVVKNNQYYFDERRFSQQENREQFHFFIKDANRIYTTLLLHEIKRRKMEEDDFVLFNQIFDWFKVKLTIVYPETEIGASYFLFDTDNESLVNILQYLDTGITDYRMREINEAAFKEYFPNEDIANQILRKLDKSSTNEIKSVLNLGKALFELDYTETGKKRIAKLMFRHGMDENQYEYGEESDGTQRLIDLLDVFLNDDKDKVFIIDELDRSLHPQMTIKFVETFLKISEGKVPN